MIVVRYIERRKIKDTSKDEDPSDGGGALRQDVLRVATQGRADGPGHEEDAVARTLARRALEHESRIGVIAVTPLLLPALPALPADFPKPCPPVVQRPEPSVGTVALQDQSVSRDGPDSRHRLCSHVPIQQRQIEREVDLVQPRKHPGHLRRPRPTVEQHGHPGERTSGC